MITQPEQDGDLSRDSSVTCIYLSGAFHQLYLNLYRKEGSMINMMASSFCYNSEIFSKLTPVLGCLSI